MKIHNIRRGFATNSSSSHSVILLRSGATVDGYGADGDFCWQQFVLQDPSDKLRYLGAALRAALSPSMSDHERDSIVKDWVNPPQFSSEDYVDHQSLWTLPRDWNTAGVNYDFVREIKEFILRDDIVILGGNDNEEPRNAPVQGDFVRSDLDSLGEWGGSATTVARKDSSGYWVLFDRSSGNKIRLTLDPGGPKPVTSDAPELVDIKITDYCPVGCKFCYQNSTTAGAHASLDFLRDLAYGLGELQTFEVALGGGEPTLHPDFRTILRYFSAHGVVPNFTTRMTNWMLDEEVVETIKVSGGAFAFSVDTSKDMDKFLSAIDRSGISKELEGHIVVQHILGVESEYVFRDILVSAHEKQLPVTLLGWKTTGRGSLVKPISNGKWLDIVAELRKVGQCPAIGVDTCIVQRDAEKLRSYGVDPRLWTSREGVFSAYIDAVKKEMYRSSYELDVHAAVYKQNSEMQENLRSAWLKIRQTES